MAAGFDRDPHSERGHACPRNKFEITDYAKLQELEGPLVIKRTGELRDRGVSGKFDILHLKSIHKYLFQDVFPWAGDFRVVNISKGTSPFAPVPFLEASLADLFEKMKAERLLSGLDAAEFTSRAAFYLGELNAIHPFREGNGRTQREFLRQLALGAGHPLSWAGFTQERMTSASILSHVKGDHSALAEIVAAALFSTRKNAAQP